MATSIEHYRKAEEILANTAIDESPMLLLARMQAAQVHATLALAAATALGVGNADISDTADDWQAWYDEAAVSGYESVQRNPELANGTEDES